MPPPFLAQSTPFPLSSSLITPPPFQPRSLSALLLLTPLSISPSISSSLFPLSGHFPIAHPMPTPLFVSCLPFLSHSSIPPSFSLSFSLFPLLCPYPFSFFFLSTLLPFLHFPFSSLPIPNPPFHPSFSSLSFLLLLSYLQYFSLSLLPLLHLPPSSSLAFPNPSSHPSFSSPSFHLPLSHLLNSSMSLLPRSLFPILLPIAPASCGGALRSA